MPENTQNKMLSKTIAVIGGAAILLTSAITILQTRKSVSVKTPTAVKTLHTPETTATASTTHAKIQKLLNDGTFDQMPIVAGHHIKEELTKALEQGNERLVTGRLADAGYAIFNGDGRTPQTRQTGALLYTLAAQNATEHDLHNPTSESAQRSVKWLRTTKYGQALNAE